MKNSNLAAEMVAEDPLREAVIKQIEHTFRPDDPPEVRELLIQAALERERAYNRACLEP